MNHNRSANRLSRRTLMKQTAAAATLATAGSQASTLMASATMQDRPEIVHWVHPLSDDDTVVLNPIIEEFQAAGNEVDVKVEIIPWDGRIERKLSAAAAGTSPDTSYLNVDEFTTYAIEGALVGLNDYVTQESIDDLLPGPQDAMNWEDSIYLMPVLHAFRVAYINRAVWEASGLDPEATPLSWEELDTALAAVKAAKDSGAHQAWATAMEGSGSGPTPTLRNFNPWFYQAGGSLITEEGLSGYDSDAGIAAAEYATHLFQNYTSESDRASTGEDLNERFGQGQVAYINSQEVSLIKVMETDFPELDFAVANTTGDAIRWNHGGVGGYGVWVASDQVDATFSWIDYLTSTGNLAFTQGFGFFPARESVRAEFEKGLGEHLAGALAQQEWAGVEKHPRLWDMWDAISPELQAAFAGQKSPEDAVRTAAERINNDYLS
jgi:multiple sugar transport system substrate-binding protein